MKPRWSIVAVVPHGDHLLAIARNFNPHDVNLPGGHAGPKDKSATDTLKRKIEQETGIHVVNYTRMDVWDGEYGQKVYAYFVTKWTGKTRTASAGKVFWARPHQLALPSATFAEDNVRLLKTLLRV